MRHFKQITWEDRIRIEALLQCRHSIPEIAKILKKHQSSVYREIKRAGYYRRRASDWADVWTYSPDQAQADCDERKAMRGAPLKIGKDIALADWLEDIMLNKQYSPEAALAEIRRQRLTFSVTLSVPTIYSYIEKGVFLHLTNSALIEKGKRKDKHKHIVRRRRAPYGASIEDRKDDFPNLESRSEFGHWEMDCVCNCEKGPPVALLVLTERKTRKELIRYLPRKTTECVVTAINGIERKMGSTLFRRVFKSITVDNGPEFADCIGLEKSRKSNSKRSSIYYCHPYSAFERGSNELQNRFLRRRIPKGTDLSSHSRSFYKELESWINDYPREILGWKNANEAFEEELLAFR